MNSGIQPTCVSAKKNCSSGTRSNTPDVMSWLATKPCDATLLNIALIGAKFMSDSPVFAASCIRVAISAAAPPPKLTCAVIGTSSSTASLQKRSSTSSSGVPEPFGQACSTTPRMPGMVETRRSSSVASSMFVAGRMARPSSRSRSTAVNSCESQSL